MSDPSSEEPKIIVDSDWKEQARKEKEELERKRAEAQPSESSADASAEPGKSNDSATPTADSNAAADSSSPGGEQPALPEASFSLLVSSLVTQAAVALGQMPDPVSGTTSVNKPMAKHVIDTLAVLDEKTKGNLSEEEGQLLEMMLHQLRVAFVAINK